MSVDRVKIGRNNKSRAKGYEREVANILGGKRHPADTGGPEDVSHPELAIQIKSGKTVVTAAMRAGLVSARKAAAENGKLPALVLVDRRGTQLQRWVCFPLEEFADWRGYSS